MLRSPVAAASNDLHAGMAVQSRRLIAQGRCGQRVDHVAVIEDANAVRERRIVFADVGRTTQLAQFQPVNPARIPVTGSA